MSFLAWLRPALVQFGLQVQAGHDLNIIKEEISVYKVGQTRHLFRHSINPPLLRG